MAIALNSPSKPSPRQAPRSSWDLPAAPLGAGGTGVAPAAHTRLPPPQRCFQLLSQHKSLQQTLTLRASRLHQQSWACRRAVRTGSLRWRSPGFVGLKGTQPVAASPLPRSPGSATSQPRATPTGESVATPQGKREQPPGAGTGHPSWGHTAVPVEGGFVAVPLFLRSPDRRTQLWLFVPPSAAFCCCLSF